MNESRLSRHAYFIHLNIDHDNRLEILINQNY